MVEQLFTSLDEDCDGQVLLEDFLELFLGSTDIFGPKNHQKTKSKLFNEQLCLSPSIEVSVTQSGRKGSNFPSNQKMFKSSDFWH